VGPLQRKVLEYEKPELVTGLVEFSARDVGMNPDGVHTGLSHQRGVRAQKLLGCPGGVSVRGQVVDPTQEDTPTVEVDLPVPELHAAGAETRLLFCLLTRQDQLVQWLLAPIPRRPDPYIRQVEADLEAVLPLLDLESSLELDALSLEAQRTYPSSHPDALLIPGVEVYVRHATPGVICRGRERTDAHASIDHEADLFEDAARVYVGCHTVPPGPHAADSLAVVLIRFFGAEYLYEQLVLAIGYDHIGNVELERGEVSLVVAQVDAVEPDSRRVVNAPKPEGKHRAFGKSPVHKPAPVQYEPLISRKGIF
jgi:hypothetical protein